MKIPPKAFVLSLCWSFLLSVACYFLLWFLCTRYLSILIYFVFLISIIICLSLCYISAVHYKVFIAEMKGESLNICKGFIIKRNKYVNLSFALSVKSASTPLMRLLKLRNLLIMFEGSVCLLPLIKAEDAEIIYDRILRISEKNEKI